MAKINLLPWRDELRAQRQREFYVMLAGAAVAAVFAVFVWWYWMGMRLDNQDARNAYLKEMDRVFRSLARNPSIGRACDEIREGYRKLPHGAHVIYYRQASDTGLLIVRILHATMDVDSNIGA